MAVADHWRGHGDLFRRCCLCQPELVPVQARARQGRATWNYVAIHAYGRVEFFEDQDRLLDLVSRLTNLYEQPRQEPWAVTDAPAPFIKAQLKGIAGLRLPISRLEGKMKMSQNRSQPDREGVVTGLSSSEQEEDRVVAHMVRSDGL